MIVIFGNWFILFHNFLIIMFDQRRVVVVVMNLFHVYILHWYIIRLQGLFFPSIHRPSGEAFAPFDDPFLLPMAKPFVLEKQIWQ